MAYLNDLKWMKQLTKFKPNEQKVLLALSNEKFKWRTKKKIREATGLDKDQVEKSLAHLLGDSWIRASFSKNKKLIFGLVERLED